MYKAELVLEFLNYPMGARNRLGIELSYRPREATQPGGIGSSESILGLLLKKLGSEFFYFYGPQVSIPRNRFRVRINSVVELILVRGGEGEPKNEVDSSFKNYHLNGTWPTRFHTWFLHSSRNLFFLP